MKEEVPLAPKLALSEAKELKRQVVLRVQPAYPPATEAVIITLTKYQACAPLPCSRSM